jgi:hypothetical protein
MEKRRGKGILSVALTNLEGQHSRVARIGEAAKDVKGHLWIAEAVPRLVRELQEH